jgi:uncharacterized membrane protein YbaN (DUF454 family)
MRLQRWTYAGLGVVCVGIGAVGVFVPGLPTTIFLIVASWLFTRSCPWLEERLIRIPLFKPFLPYLSPDTPMPRRAVVVTLVVMWIAVACSALLLLLGQNPRPAGAALVAGLGVIGSLVVLWIAKRRAKRALDFAVPGRSES